MKTYCNILIAFILNLTFSILEFFGGLFTNSVAILSDSVHDLATAINSHMREDVLGWVVVLVGVIVMNFEEKYELVIRNRNRLHHH